jgi:hypothetical protein
MNGAPLHEPRPVGGRWRCGGGRLLLAAAAIWLGWLAVRHLPGAAALEVLGRLTPAGLSLLALLNIALFACAALRWQHYVRTLGDRPPLRRLMGYRVAAAALSYVTPGPQVGGEPLQVLWLTRRHGVAAERAMAGVALDRLTEWSGNLMIIALGLALALRRPAAAEGIAGWGLPLIGCGLWLPLGYLLALGRGWRPLGRMLSVAPLWRPLLRSVGWLARAEQAAAARCREHPVALVVGMALSVAGWGVALAEWGVLFALLGRPLAPGELVIAAGVTRCAFLVPVPAGIGVLEACMALVGRLLAMEPALVLAACAVIRLRDVLMAVSGLGLAWHALHRLPGRDLAGPLTHEGAHGG